MAYELTKVELFGPNREGEQMSFTIASSAYVTLGSLMILSDPRTVAINTSGIANPIAGILAKDKIYDFSTRVSLWEAGVFEAYASGAVTKGSPVCTTYIDVNKLQSAVGVVAASGAAIVGIALEDASDGEKFTFVRKGIGG